MEWVTGGIDGQRRTIFQQYRRQCFERQTHVKLESARTQFGPHQSNHTGFYIRPKAESDHTYQDLLLSIDKA